MAKTEKILFESRFLRVDYKSCHWFRASKIVYFILLCSALTLTLLGRIFWKMENPQKSTKKKGFVTPLICTQKPYSGTLPPPSNLFSLYTRLKYHNKSFRKYIFGRYFFSYWRKTIFGYIDAVYNAFYLFVRTEIDDYLLLTKPWRRACERCWEN